LSDGRECKFSCVNTDEKLLFKQSTLSWNGIHFAFSPPLVAVAGRKC